MAAILIDLFTMQEYKVDNVFTIGREAGNSFVSDHICVSRDHCFINLHGSGGYTLTEAGSLNGTLLNEDKLTPGIPTTILDGDTITLGNIEVEIHRIENDPNPEMDGVCTHMFQFIDVKLRNITNFGLLRCIPKLLAWRLRATKVVFYPKRMRFILDDDDAPQPKRQVVIID